MPEVKPKKPVEPVVIGSGKDRDKGFYRDIRMPNGVIRREWSLFSEETKQRHKRERDEFNNKVGWASAPGLQKVGASLIAGGAAMGAGAYALAKKTPELAAKYAARQREKYRVNPVVKRAGKLHSILDDDRTKLYNQTVTKGQIKRTGNFAGGKGTRPAANQRMRLTRQQYNARLDPRLGGQSSSLLGGQTSQSLRGQSSTFTPSTAAQREEAIQAMQIRKHGSPLQGQSSQLPRRGSTMPQTGDLFDQPEPPKTRSKGGTKGGAKGGTKGGATGGGGTESGGGAKGGGFNRSSGQLRSGRVQGVATKASNTFGGVVKGSGTALRPTPLAPVRIAGSPSVTAARPTPLAPVRIANSPSVTAARPTPLAPVRVPNSPLASNARPTITNKSKSTADLKAVEDAVNRRRAVRAGTAAPGARFRPGPVPDSPGAMRAESAATAGRPRVTLRPVGSGPKPTPSGPTPQFGPTPTGTKPYVPPGRSAIPTFTTPKPKVGFLGKVGNFAKGFGGPGLAVGHLLEDAASGIQSAAQGDWKNAGHRALDLLGHGPMGPAGFVQNDIIDIALGRKIARGKPTSIGDRIIHGKIFPDRYYSDGETPKAAATPAASGGNKPAGGGTSQKPSGSAYFPEAARNGSAVRTPDSYLGEAFDYSLQKGTTSGSKYLEHMFRRDKISADDQQRLRERFNKKVVGDQTLQTYGADKGITENVESKTPGLGKALLEKYRDTGSYKGNTDYGKMRSAAEARLAASKK